MMDCDLPIAEAAVHRDVTPTENAMVVRFMLRSHVAAL